MPQPQGVGDQPASGWQMNSSQRFVLAIGLAAFLGLALFPHSRC